MKKTIIIEILLLFIFAVLIACTSKLLVYIAELKQEMIDYGLTQGKAYQLYSHRIDVAITYAIPTLLAAVSTVIAMIIIAVKDFPCFKPLVDKLHAKRTANQQAKAEQAEIRKQERIEKLQAELDALKKDDNASS